MLSDHHEGLPHLGVAKAERRDGACDEGFGQLVGDLIGGDHFKGGLVDIGEAEGSAAGSRGGLLVLEQGGDLGLVRGVLSCDLADLVLVPLLGVLLATLLEIERGAGFRCCTTKTITGRSEKRNEMKRNETKRNETYHIGRKCEQFVRMASRSGSEYAMDRRPCDFRTTCTPWRHRRSASSPRSRRWTRLPTRTVRPHALASEWNASSIAAVREFKGVKQAQRLLCMAREATIVFQVRSFMVEIVPKKGRFTKNMQGIKSERCEMISST